MPTYVDNPPGAGTNAPPISGKLATATTVAFGAGVTGDAGALRYTDDASGTRLYGPGDGTFDVQTKRGGAGAVDVLTNAGTAGLRITPGSGRIQSVNPGVAYLASIWDALSLSIQSSGSTVADFVAAGINIADAKNIAVGTGTGTMIGTGITEKLGFHGVAGTAQRAGAAQVAVATTAATSVTPFGYTTQAQADAIVTLVNEMRAWAVAKGFIKGAA
jgi:hypothetical protein